MEGRAEALVEHYQRTYEVVQGHWRQRNRIFLLLVGAIGVGLVLTWRSDTHALMVDVIGRLLEIDSGRREKLQFPFGLLQSTLLVAIFYWMVNLYHRSVNVARHYQYLGDLEKEIRAELQLAPGAIAFTREGTYYWGRRPPFLGMVKWVYVVMLGALLAVFLGARVWDDRGRWLLVAVDVALAIPILMFYVGYATASVRLDAPRSSQAEDGGRSAAA